jgi:hypothetical protein
MEKVMKRVAVSMMLAFGLALTVTTHAEVTGRIFQVTVKSSFGTPFTDCFRFDVPVTSFLSIDGLPQGGLMYRHGQLDLIATSFKAVSHFGQPLAIMFYGEEVEGLERLNGEAVNEFGDTFVFSGIEVASCVLRLLPQAKSPQSPWSSQ